MLAKECDVKGERHGEHCRALIPNLGKRSRTFGVGWVGRGGGAGVTRREMQRAFGVLSPQEF